jgi:rfaE bifunctional protein nucleotidyltransferase chain/domain
LSELRVAGQTVVQCDGIFDPLHIGHIKHLEQARKLGDALIVTVTPDRFVNRGPNRPIFPENLRAESVAALECVDFVAINDFPAAVEAIRRLRPNVFVRGSEYARNPFLRQQASDEEQAVTSGGGRMSYTNEIRFSSSNLVNQHLSIFPKGVSDFLARFSEEHPAPCVLGFVERIRPLKILLVGETIIDEYHFCEAIGKSSKEPTLAVKALHVEEYAGGVLAAANHLANFCDHVSLTSMVGDQNSRADFIQKKLSPTIRTRFVRRPESPTIIKHRFIEFAFCTKLFEVYEINDKHFSPAEDALICNALRGQIAEFDVVQVLDFGHEMLTPQAIHILCDEAKFLAVNAQTNAANLGYHTISKYPRADFVCITESEARLDARDRRGDLRGMLEKLARRLNCRAVMVTRGDRGCQGFAPDQGFADVPAFASKVVDRIGAGDAFYSLTAPCIAQGAPLAVAGFIGNVIGALAVGIVGNRSAIDRASFIQYLETLLK